MGVAVNNFYIDLLLKFLLIKNLKDSQCQVSIGVACYNSSTYSWKDVGIHIGPTSVLYHLCQTVLLTVGILSLALLHMFILLLNLLPKPKPYTLEHKKNIQ